MEKKKLYISPAMYARKIYLKTYMMSGSDHSEETGNGAEDADGSAKRSRFSAYDGFGTKSEESSSDTWK